jgi:hypothetical protein
MNNWCSSTDYKPNTQSCLILYIQHSVSTLLSRYWLLQNKPQKIFYFYSWFIWQLINSYTIKFLDNFVLNLLWLKPLLFINYMFLQVPSHAWFKYHNTTLLFVTHSSGWLTWTHACNEALGSVAVECGMWNAYSSNWEECQLWTEFISVN